MKLISRAKLAGSCSPDGGGFIIKRVPDGNAVKSPVYPPPQLRWRPCCSCLIGPNKRLLLGIHAAEDVLVSAPVRFVPACLLRPVGDSGNSGLEVFPKQDV